MGGSSVANAKTNSSPDPTQSIDNSVCVYELLLMDVGICRFEELEQEKFDYNFCIFLSIFRKSS